MNTPQHINSEELLSVLFYSPNATAVYQGENIKILTANQAMLNLWGKDRSVTGKNFIDAIPELRDQPFLDILKKVWSTGKTYYAKDTSAMLEVDGIVKEFFFDFEYKAILNEDGTTRYILHTAFEVSDRMKAWRLVEEKSLKEQELIEDLLALNEEYQATNEELMSTNEELMTSEENLNSVLELVNEKEHLFRVMVEQSPVAMASLKGSELIVDVANEHVLKIWGKNISVVGLPLQEALPEIKDQGFLEILKNVYETDTPFHGKELRAVILVDGIPTERFLNFIYQPTNPDQNGEKYILIVAIDVTEQVNARKSVSDVNTRFQIALDAGKLGSTEVHLASGTMQSTDQFKKNYGFLPEEDFKYSDLFEAMFPEYRDRVKNLVQEAIRTNGTYTAEYPVKWRDGSTHWIQAHGRPRYDENGNADRMVGMTLDITEKKLFDQQKDDFLSVASHELRTPITILKASLQYLDRIKDRPFGEPHRKMISQSLTGIDRMTEMVDGLLNVRRLTEGQLQIRKNWFNMYDMLSVTCNHIRVEGKYSLILEGEKDIRVFADEHRIDQVVINFVNNAVKYASDSDKIYLSVSTEGNCVKVSVKDFGEGISEEILPKIFDRYYRASHSGNEYSGLGLGLYICSEIIKQHGGEIGADSNIGEGSTFWFTIPIMQK
ncbi:PAS domain-containing sensor histidine kinase [Chryseobacterium caseinilyticum]|uniref:histidine kinase n=1 Tax=Chryseobacterium caseinilyticum TaxID=2771428 RepID=A0ABR8ZGQ5_9FLAO|nr:ATP-binding protein [Chryseobacterium caseinilyticum]MBD8083861.1 PAS domain S-box protein [Chryseobacterium caseinilyticum]